MDCLFCKIIKGEIGSNRIYEDDKVLVFLDINPATNGDSLVVPKEHYQDFKSIPDDMLIHMYNTIKKIYPMYQEKLGCEGLTLTHNTDYGQEIKHLHIHFIPRYKDDKISYLSDKSLLKDLDEVEKILKK